MPTTVHDPIEKWRDDKLRRQNDVDRLLARLSDPECAQVVGLYGTWGTGKTSFLQMAADRYPEWHAEKEPGQKLSLQFVDAWLYEQTGNLATPVMARLWKMVQSREEFKAAIRKAALLTILTLTNAALHATTGLKLEDIGKQLKELEEREEARLNVVDLIDQARADFKQAVEAACEAQACDQIVFMIDNLDRCFPDNVVALLESIKNIFSASRQCMWVLAVDPDVVASYIDQKYQGTSMDGYSYLDKIVPEQFHLPLPVVQGETFSLTAFLSRFLKPGQSINLPFAEQQLILQLPRTLIPRRLIKAARKYSEVAQPSQHTFALILLYYCWPNLYRWLSVDNMYYIQGVLGNFLESSYLDTFPSDMRVKVVKMELPKNLTDDPELRLFIRSTFQLSSLPPQEFSNLAEAVRQTVLGLRRVGLP
jgi:hypothetical protein